MKWKPTRDFFGKIMAVRGPHAGHGSRGRLDHFGILEAGLQRQQQSLLARYLDIACEDLGNRKPAGALFRAIPFAPPMLCGFIELGEETSALPTVLRKSAEMLELEVDEVIQTFTQLLEPLLVGMMWAFCRVCADCAVHPDLPDVRSA